MIAPEKTNSMGVFNFIEHKQFESLNWIVSPVYKIPYENVILAIYAPAQLKKLQYIIKLSVDISANNHRRSHLDYVILHKQYLLDFLAVVV